MLIVSDDTAKTQVMVQKLLKALRCNDVIFRKAHEFAATDLLATEVYFFGCEYSSPASFVSFERVLRHINLVGRSCGLFSPTQEKAVEYLSRLVFDSELALYPVPFFGDSEESIELWAEDVLAYKSGGVASEV